MQRATYYTSILCVICFNITLYAQEQPAGITESNSFMLIRPAFMSLSSDQATWHELIYNKRIKGGHSFQVKAINQQSISSDQSKQYFLFGCNNSLLVAGDNTILRSERDVRAEWLGIKNNQFTGSLTIDPYQKQSGATITYHKDLSTAASFLDGFWLSLEVPFFSTKHNLNLKQFDIGQTTEQYPNDILSAFSQRSWLYSKINGPTIANNILGGFLKFGHTFLSENHFQVIGYSLLNFAFGNGQNARYLFDAYTGVNRHVGIGGGAHFQILLNKDASSLAICWYVGLENQYFFPNVQLRTFDLKRKPWSRYMLYNHKNKGPNQNIPGVNILTYQALIRPYSFIDFQTGWRFISEKFEFELGYELWGRGNERVKIHSDFQQVFGIAGTNGASASESTIANQASNDPIFTTFKESDIDLCSAAASSALNHKLTCSLGYLKKGVNTDLFFTIGGASEYAQKNAALSVWTIWIKAGATQ